MKSRLPLLIAAALVGALLSRAAVAAPVAIELTGTPGSSTINIAISGEATVASGTHGFGAFNIDFPGEDFTPSFFSQVPITGTTILTNTTTMASEPIDDVFLDIFPDGVNLSVASPVTGSGGELLAFSGTGAFDLTGGTFDDLTPGVYSGDFTNAALAGNGVTLTVAQVPEPASVILAVLGLAGAGALVIVRRRSPTVSH